MKSKIYMAPSIKFTKVNEVLMASGDPNPGPNPVTTPVDAVVTDKVWGGEN